MKFEATTLIKGVGEKAKKAGEVFEAKLEDVKHLLHKEHGGDLDNKDMAAVVPADERPKK